MQKPSIADALRALATDDTARSETARLRDIIDDIEAALSAGVSRAAILKTLHDQSFTMTAKSFESALYRIRKQRSKKEQQSTENQDKPRKEDKPEKTVSVNPEPEEDLSGLTDKQRRERVADKYINTEPKNPLLKRLLDKDKNKDDKDD
jgi:hypothetical protein